MDWDFNYYMALPPDGKGRTFLAVDQEKAFRANQDSQADVFWTPQEFPLGERKKADLISVRCICADFDGLHWDAFQERFAHHPTPGLVISTRSGVHAYWPLKRFIPYSEKLPEAYRHLVETKLVPFGADNNAKDTSRILRPPMMKYWWDSKGNFYGDRDIYTQIAFSSPNAYTWEQIERYFPTKTLVEKPYIDKTSTFRPQKMSSGGDFWTRANELDVRMALERLSGTSFVRGERFQIKRDRVLVDNGKGFEAANVWIDAGGKIGSTDRGGPTIVNWLGWYGHSMKEVAEIMKTVFPELKEKV